MSLDIPTCVIAPTYETFAQWCRDHEIHPKSKGVVWVRGAAGLRGRRNVRVVKANEHVMISQELQRELDMMEATGCIAPPPVMPTAVQRLEQELGPRTEPFENCYGQPLV